MQNLPSLGWSGRREPPPRWVLVLVCLPGFCLLCFSFKCLSIPPPPHSHRPPACPPPGPRRARPHRCHLLPGPGSASEQRCDSGHPWSLLFMCQSDWEGAERKVSSKKCFPQNISPPSFSCSERWMNSGLIPHPFQTGSSRPREVWPSNRSPGTGGGKARRETHAARTGTRQSPALWFNPSSNTQGG